MAYLLGKTMAENSDGRTLKFTNINAAKAEDFVSHRSFIEEQRSQYYSRHPFLLLDYTEQYLLHIHEKELRLQQQKEEKKAPPIHKTQQEKAPPPSENMADLMSFMNPQNNNTVDEEDEDSDGLFDIKKDFVSPYAQESASTMMMPAADLLAQAALEEEEDAKALGSFTFDPMEGFQAQQLYAKLEQVLNDIVKEWKDYKDDYEDRDAVQRFEYAVIKKIDGMIAQIQKLPEKNKSFLNNWIQGTLFKFIDEFFILFSKSYSSAYAGDMASARVRNWLQEILFGRFNDIFVQLQWFSIDMLLPLQSEFDPREHVMTTKQNAGREFRNYVVGIEKAGIFSYDGETRVRKAHVIMGS